MSNIILRLQLEIRNTKMELEQSHKLRQHMRISELEEQVNDMTDILADELYQVTMK